MKKDESKRERLINDNYGLVHACANKLRNKGIEYEDLFQAGCVGLVKAADNFDEERGFAFSTYAVPVILGEIRRIFRDGGSVKIGRTLKEKSRYAMSVRQEREKELQREPTVGELAEKLGIEPSEAAELINVSMPTVSLTAYDDDSEEKQLDIPTESFEEKISDRLSLYAVLKELPEKDKSLIYLRYFKGMTQIKAAEKLGMSQVQVSRREKAILSGMREKLN